MFNCFFLLIVTDVTHYLDHGGKSQKKPFTGVKMGALIEQDQGWWDVVQSTLVFILCLMLFHITKRIYVLGQKIELEKGQSDISYPSPHCAFLDLLWSIEQKETAAKCNRSSLLLFQAIINSSCPLRSFLSEFHSHPPWSTICHQNNHSSGQIWSHPSSA